MGRADAIMDHVVAAPSSPSVEPESPLQLLLLGQPRWQVGSRSGALSRIDAAWLAMVALGGTRREAPRDRLAAWLWPEVPQKTANTNLRQRLFKLRQATGRGLVEAGALWRLEPAVAVQGLDDRPVPEGELLGGLDFGDLPELDAWVQHQREALRGARADALSAEAAQLEAAGALAAAIAVAERLVALAPALEHGWRRLMRLHYLRGDRAAAVTTFERFETQVCRDLGLRPSDETLALLHTVEQGAGAAATPVRPLAAALVRPPRLVGRDDAWRAVQAAWHGGRAALVLGEGGLGKSRLLAELVAALGDTGAASGADTDAGAGAATDTGDATMADPVTPRAATGASGSNTARPVRAPEPRPRSLRVLETRARPGDGAMPYATVTSLLEQALAAHPGGAAALPAPARRELARLLPALGDAPAAAARQAFLWQAIEGLLAGCQACVVADDLHFADTASLELLRWLLASPRLTGLRWLLAARPDEPEPAAALLRQWLGDSSRIEPVRLKALSAAEVGVLLHSLALQDLQRPDAPTAAELHRHAGGNPFFTLETLKSLALAAGERGGMPLPASAGALLQRRIERLSPLARQLLRALALAPGALDLALSGTVLAGASAPHAAPGAAAATATATETTTAPAPDTLAAAWAELESAQLARDAQPAHDLVREQVLADWPAPSRIALARSLASALEAQGGRRRLTPVQLARLWQAAQDDERAARCLAGAAAEAARAGRLAEQRSLLLEAAALWDRVDGATPGASASAATDSRLLAAHATLLQEGSAAALALVPGLEARAATPAQRASLAVLRAHAALNEARFADALQDADHGRVLAPEGSALARDAALLHARALALNGRAAEALAALRASAEDADRRGDAAQALDAQGALAHALQVVGQYGEAVRSQQRACDAARALGDPVALAQTLCNLASLQSLAGDAGAARTSAREADAQFTRLGIGDAHQVYNRITWARCAAHLGRFDEALQALPAGEALDAVQASVGASIGMMVRLIRHGVHVWLGTPGAEALPLPPEAGAETTESPLVRVSLLMAHLRRGESPRQGPWLAQLQQLGDQHPVLRNDPVLAREWCRLGDPADDAHRLETLARHCREAGAVGLARSLELVRLDRLGLVDRPAAHHLADGLWQELQAADALLHPATHPPTAWTSLAWAFQAAGDPRAGAARERAARWLAEARLPPGCERERLCRDLVARA